VHHDRAGGGGRRAGHRGAQGRPHRRPVPAGPARVAGTA
jgi:hypothetical protein